MFSEFGSTAPSSNVASEAMNLQMVSMCNAPNASSAFGPSSKWDAATSVANLSSSVLVIFACWSAVVHYAARFGAETEVAFTATFVLFPFGYNFSSRQSRRFLE